MIPKIIHQIWIGPKKPPLFMKKWSEFNPDFEYILWDNEKVKKLLPLKNQKQYENYGENYAGKSDLLRIEILNKYGGIYIDADTEPLKPLDNHFLENDFFSCYINEKRRPNRIANGVIGSTSNHPILNEYINNLEKKTSINEPAFVLSGPVYFTNILKNFLDEIKIYPSYYFYPRFFDGLNYNGDFKPYGDHKWGSTKNLYELNNKSVSIVIPTYKNKEYIDECIVSIVESGKDYDIEILVGIDACEETLKYVKSKSYPEFIKFYYFNENVGPYVIKNSLTEITNSENLIFFDSDDIMLKTTIEEVVENFIKCDFIRLRFQAYINGKLGNVTNKFGEGVIAIKKKLFLRLNGYRPWKVAADSDFNARLYKINPKIHHTKNISFYYRQHKTSLTKRPDTGMASKLRSDLWKSRNDLKPLNKLHTVDFEYVDVLSYEIPKDFKYDNLVNKEKLNKVLNPTPRKIVDKKITKSDPVVVDRLEILYKNRPEPVRIVKTNIPENRQQLIDQKNNMKNTLNSLFPKKTNPKDGKNMINFGGKLNR